MAYLIVLIILLLAVFSKTFRKIFMGFAWIIIFLCAFTKNK